ncbi:MAG: LCP family protein [Sphingobacteriaceae bacterium]|nr:LCP family protein [Sphingobacteriaceae bacterium]
MRETNTKKSNLKPVLLIIAGVFVVSGLTVASYIYSQLNKVSSFGINKSPKALGISSLLLGRIDSLDKPPVNIALFGLDKRPADKYGNSDAIMIISISEAANKLKLSSIMRDTYVKIDSVGMDKINAAYRIGGPQLALKTLNQNFNLHIKDFVSVNFNGMANVIDALGGVNIPVKKEEVRWLNSYLDENNKDSRVKPPYISKSGPQTLNGKQAVAYTRIRQVGDDYERTQRQRVILSLLLKKLKSSGTSEYPNIVSKILPFVETSIPKFQLLTMGAKVYMNNNIRTIEEKRFPLHTESHGKMINGTWYLDADMKATSKSLYNFMFEGSKPE